MEMPMTVYAVSTRYSENGVVYAQAAFPTRALAEAYVRYSKMVNKVLPAIEFIISDFQYYELDFEATHIRSLQGELFL